MYDLITLYMVVNVFYIKPNMFWELPLSMNRLMLHDVSNDSGVSVLLISWCGLA